MQNLSPMLPGASGEPFDDPAYIYDLTPPGVPCIAYIELFIGASVRDMAGNRMQAIYPELSKLNMYTQWRCILDGYVYSDTGKPGTYYFTATDIIYYGHEMINNVPLIDRKKILSMNVRGNDLLRLSRYQDKDAIRFCVDHSGIIAKRKDSIYSPGDVSKDWIRINPYHDGSYIICGYTTDGRNTNLVLAKVKNGALVYKGIAEIANMESMELIKSHKIYKSSLFALPKNISAVWIKPDMVCEVKHEVYVVGNLHIKFIKLRPDKNAWDCTGEF